MEETTNNNTVPTQDPGKTVAIISYITLIGLIIAFVMHSEQRNKSELGVFHLRQALGIYLTSFSMMIASFILVFIPFIGWMIAILINLCYIGIFIFWILGLIGAVNGERKAVPLLGAFYQNVLKDIK